MNEQLVKLVGCITEANELERRRDEAYEAAKPYNKAVDEANRKLNAARTAVEEAAKPLGFDSTYFIGAKHMAIKKAAEETMPKPTAAE